MSKRLAIVSLLIVLAANLLPGPSRASMPFSMDIRAGDPVYTTLAAATERSRFTPDQAYHFRYDTNGETTALTSRWAGDWGLVFAMNDRVVSSPDEMYEPWVIDRIGTDRVVFHGKPFESCEVRVEALVYSSSVTLLNLRLRGEGEVTVASVIDNARLYSIHADTSNTLHFSHDHPADRWTLEHGVPHPVRRYNELAMSPPADEALLLGGLHHDASQLGLEWVQPDSTPLAPLYGRVTRPDGRPVNVPEEHAQVIALIEEDGQSLLSLDTPLRQHSWDSWKRRGYYAVESGLLQAVTRRQSLATGMVDLDSNTVRVIASLPDEGLSGVTRTRFAPATGPQRARSDLTLTPSPAAAPRNLRIEETADGITLHWDGDPDARYGVYWRHIKPRVLDRERRQVELYREDFTLARGMGLEIFRRQTDVIGLSSNYPLSRTERLADGTSRQVAFDPATEPFARQQIVVLLDDDGLPVAASNTASFWPYPALTDVLSGTNSAAADTDAVVLPAVALVKTFTLIHPDTPTHTLAGVPLAEPDRAWQQVSVIRTVDDSEAALSRHRWTAKALINNPVWELSSNPANKPPLRPTLIDSSRRQGAAPDPAQPRQDAGYKSDRNRMLASAKRMMSQMMLPPEGQLQHPYYVFSREPTWGWGHSGQVFHESLSMLAHGVHDIKTAQQSMEVFKQAATGEALNWDTPGGYIPYRVGPYLRETIPSQNGVTSSGPFFAWTVQELYSISGDTAWLREMEWSVRASVEFWLNERDADNDSLYSWGGNAVLESLRDASAVVWDEVAPPDSLETVGLNSMLANELTSTREIMLLLLDDSDNVIITPSRADPIVDRVRTHLWDDEDGFFYHIPKRIDANSSTPDPDRFSYAAPNDLKRKEITGFLPLWAGIATEDQAERLVREHLLNEDEFWRPYGIPSLAANDPSYDPQGYWNGPVWVPWNYLVFRGLLRYGYVNEARELAERVSAGMIEVLSETHDFWEFYSPEEAWGGHHRSYIWSGLVVRMWWDLEQVGH